MTNKEIRRQVWELCREKFGLILSATFLLSLISSLATSVAAYLNAPGLSLILVLGLFALSAIMSVGMVRFILDIWHGETPALSVLFSMKHRFWTYVGFMLLIPLICIGIFIGVMLPGIMISSLAMVVSDVVFQVVLIALAIVAYILILWFVIRFEMTLTCMVVRRTGGVTECMRIAWRASKGNVWRLLCNAFVLGLPLFAAQALLIGYQTYLMMTGQMLNTVGSLLLDIGSVLISALLSGYIYLGTYPLHEQLLDAYFAANPQLSALEAFDNLFPQSTEDGELYVEDDEYEDIPEDEEKPQE